MKNNIRLIFNIFDKSERLEAFRLLLLIVLMAVFDVVGIASIMPFMAVMSTPEIINENVYLKGVYEYFNFSDSSSFLIFVGLVVFFALLSSLFIKSLAIYKQLNFALKKEYTISKRLIEGYLKQEYSWIVERNSSELSKTILAEVSQLIYQAVLPLMIVIAQGTAAAAIFVLLCIVDLYLACLTAIVLGTAYSILFQLMRRRLKLIGDMRTIANTERYKASSEAFGGIKEIKLLGCEGEYTERYAQAAEVYANCTAESQIIAQVPRYALEAIAFGGMLLVLLYQMSSNNEMSAILPIIALYAFAGYRLMPAVQQMYGGLTQLKFADSVLKKIYEEFKLIEASEREGNADKGKVLLEKNIELHEVSFCYPNAEKNALNGINLNIESKTSLGIIGTTGGGKSTCLDVILGLLEPINGCLKVDGIAISRSNVDAWQKIIGYVPQDFFLKDGSIESNIAFGYEEKDIDRELLIESARSANLHEFIMGELPHGYKTSVGENGMRLSGGQRQRIAIARALYRKPRLLVFDEATSALDVQTESKIVEEIKNMCGEITLIVVAHRLSTVKDLDEIAVFDKGEIVSQGNYQTLEKTCIRFKQMIGESL